MSLIYLILPEKFMLQVWEGQGVITYGRKLIGATDPQKSEPGTIRGDLAVTVGRYCFARRHTTIFQYMHCPLFGHHNLIITYACRNIIHGSDGPETAKDEINLWFKPEDLVNYTSNAEKWVYGVN